MIAYEYAHIAVIRADGGLSIMHIVVKAPLSAFSPDAALANGYIVAVDPASGEEFWEGGLTDEGVVMEIQRAGIHGTSWRRIAAAEIPADRTFRNAWRDTGALTVDLPAAREIVRAHVRGRRVPQFGALDAQIAPYLAKAAIGTLTPQERADMATIEAQRQTLRDAPANPAIDAAKTADELKALLA